MWIGIVGFLVVFFFARLMYRRVHARRCDQFLAPLSKVQAKLLEHHNTNSKSKKNNSNKKDDDKVDAKATEDGIPLITLQELYGALTEVHKLKIEGDDDYKNDDSRSSTSVFPLQTLNELLPASPSVALSVGGSRVIWSRAPALLRRVLLTHFRMFPGPPTKWVSASSSAAENSSVAELSDYKATAINTSVYIAAFLNQLNLNASSSSSCASFKNTNGKICSRLFQLGDGEKFWDHVTWQGGFKPGQFPDIPGLLLRGMSTKREVQYRTIRGNATIHATSSFFQQTPKNKRGEERVFSVKDSSSVSSSKLAKDSTLSYISNLLVTELLKDVVGGDEFMKTLLQAADTNVLANSSSSSSQDVTSQVSNNMLFIRNEDNKNFISSSAQNFLLCGGFAAGMSITSFPLSSLLSSSSSTKKESLSLSSTFSSLVSGLHKVLERHIDILAEAQEISTRKSVEVGESSTCGLSVALANCGSVRLHNRPGETSVMRHADRWDNLLRKTLAHKSAVVVTHLVTYAFDIYNMVLAEILLLENNNKKNNTEFRRVKSQFTDESFVLEAYVREAMRLNPLVRQAVRAVEGDDPQRAEVFGIASDLVKVLNTPDEIISLQNAAAAASSSSTTASKKAEADNQHRKMEEIIQGKLDPSLRYSLNGMIATPSSACVVCDIYSMQRNPEVFSVSSSAPADSFYPQRWAAGSAANQDVQQRSRMEANFAPLGFGAAAEASCRYLISLVSELIDETVSL